MIRAKNQQPGGRRVVFPAPRSSATQAGKTARITPAEILQPNQLPLAYHKKERDVSVVFKTGTAGNVPLRVLRLIFSSLQLSSSQLFSWPALGPHLPSNIGIPEDANYRKQKNHAGKPGWFWIVTLLESIIFFSVIVTFFGVGAKTAVTRLYRLRMLAADFFRR